MLRNIGTVDRNLRIIIGIFILGAGLFFQMSAGIRIGAYVLAAIALITAFANFCPLWRVLGISTHREGKEAEKPAQRTAEKEEKTEEGGGTPAGK